MPSKRIQRYLDEIDKNPYDLSEYHHYKNHGHYASKKSREHIRKYINDHGVHPNYD